MTCHLTRGEAPDQVATQAGLVLLRERKSIAGPPRVVPMAMRSPRGRP